MADQSSYRAEVDRKRIEQIREICRELPQCCGDFLSGIALTTGTFTRLAYALDLRTFFNYLHAERVAFADTKPVLMTDRQIGSVTKADLTAYVEYLTYYFREIGDDENTRVTETENHEKSIKRKLCALRSMYEYLFKNGRIESNIMQLVDLPKIHEKPIIRLSP